MSAASWAEAPCAPPPAITSGRRAPSRSPIAAATAPGSGGRGATGGATATSAGAGWASRSRGTSTNRARGRPDRKAPNASASSRASSAWDATRTARSTAPLMASRWSGASCKKPVLAVGCPSGIPGASTSSGTESDHACAAAVATLRTAGPVVTTTTPGRPEARA